VVKNEPEDSVSGGEEDGVSVEITERSATVYFVLYVYVRVLEEHLSCMWYQKSSGYNFHFHISSYVVRSFRN